MARIDEKPVVCPKCGGIDLALLFDEQRDNPGVRRLPGETIVRTYRCKCGVAFAITVAADPRGPVDS